MAEDHGVPGSTPGGPIFLSATVELIINFNNIIEVFCRCLKVNTDVSY